MEYKIGSILEAEYKNECCMDIDIEQNKATVLTIRIKGNHEHMDKITPGLQTLIKRHLNKINPQKTNN